MFCNQCGSQNAENTRFCNRCGFNIEPVRQAMTVAPPQSPAMTIGQKHSGLILVLSALVTIFGLATVFGTLVPLSIASHLGQGKGAALLVLLAFSGVFCVCFVVWRLLRMLNPDLKVEMPTYQPQSQQFTTGPINMNALPSQRYEPITSITEDTTARLHDYVPSRREGSY